MKHTVTSAKRNPPLSPAHSLHRITAFILALCAALLCVDAASQAPCAENAPLPNVILILADDLGYGDLSCYGQKTLATPHLDRMAAEGMKFSRFYAGSTVCAPSRCSLLTGLHTGHCRVRGNSPSLMTPDDTTIAQVLRRAGYRTGCTGKWGVGAPPPLNDPELRGFDYFYGYISMWHAHNFYPEFIIRNGRKIPLRNEVGPQWKDTDGRGIAVKKIDYVPDLVAAEAVAFIEENRDRPFFLYYAMNVPHANNEASRIGDGMEVPSWGEFSENDWPGPEKGFASMIRNIDNDVHKVLSKLEALGIDEKTLVLFTSDNGPHAEGRHAMEYFDSNGPLRGMKRDLYEGGVRVPAIAWWPGTIEAGSQTDHVTAFWDLMPTFSELAGAAAPKNDGISIVPTLTGRGRQAEHDYLYWEFYEKGSRQAVVTDRWKAVRQPMLAGPIELYDLDLDLGEENDVAHDHPDVVARMEAAMAEAHVRSPLFDVPVPKTRKARP